MPLKFDSYQIAMFLRQIVGRCLAVCLFFESFFGAFSFIAFIDKLKFYEEPIIFISLIIFLSRTFIIMPIIIYGYFTWSLWESKLLSALQPLKRKRPYFKYPTQPLYGKIAHQTIIALIITFLSSLFITILPTSMKYISQAPPKSIKDFLDDFLSYFIFTSSISLSSMIYSLQFFWRNTALTWVINILLLIFPIAPVLFFICAFIFGI